MSSKPVAGGATALGAGELDALSFIPPQRVERRRRALEQRADRLFQLFEKDGSGMCDVREVATILRAMDLNPTEAVVTQVIESIEAPESTGHVSLAKLRAVVVEMCESFQFRGTLVARESESTILAAFLALDPEGRGWVAAETLRELLGTGAEPFSTEETLEFLNAAADQDSGRVYYEDFAAVLATE